MERVCRHQQTLARDLYSKLDRNGSMVFSPFSVGALMTMLHAGTAGSSSKQIARALNIPGDDLSRFHAEFGQLMASLEAQTDAELATANLIYVQQGQTILEDFSDVVTGQFSGVVKSVNFGDQAVTSALVNNDVKRVTRGRIENLVEEDSMDGSTMAVLISAVYFRGEWRVQFPPRSTSKQEFRSSSSSTTSVSMMQLEETFPAAHLTSLQCRMLELPYKGGRFSMLLLLPEDVDGLLQLENSLAATSLADLRSQLVSQSCFILLPKFRIESTIDLLSPLRQLGVVDVFQPGAADLSRLVKHNGMFVSMVTQKAFIEVSEEGTEAAAATACSMGCFSAAPKCFYFNADHPFLFALFDRESQMVLFSGRYVGPE